VKKIYYDSDSDSYESNTSEEIREYNKNMEKSYNFSNTKEHSDALARVYEKSKSYTQRSIQTFK
jgi:hypothetical protein